MHLDTSRRLSATLFICLAVVVTNSSAQEPAEAEIEAAYVAEIEAIKADPRVQEAFEHILALEARHREELIELTEIPAPPFKEEARARRFAEMLRAAGLDDVVSDEVGNVIGRRPGRSGERVVGYSAHLDTVFPEGTDVTVRFDDDKLYA
ncbi:MAG: hypothetical protein R3315_07050, partial [Woeseiaceae bacterium]|nr:hypothetical protein [Woeseiaceae bacterium]